MAVGNFLWNERRKPQSENLQWQKQSMTFWNLLRATCREQLASFSFWRTDGWLDLTIGWSKWNLTCMVGYPMSHRRAVSSRVVGIRSVSLFLSSFYESCIISAMNSICILRRSSLSLTHFSQADHAPPQPSRMSSLVH